MAYNSNVNDFRDVEYPMLKGKTYLDHAGTTVYAKSLIEDFSRKMVENLYGNPHSASAPACLSGETVDNIRRQALEFFGADPNEFDLVFTANATAAIKIVADSFYDLALGSTSSQTFWYGYHKDAHTSLVGIRELTKETHHCFCSDDEVETWLEDRNSKCNRNTADNESIPGLFAYPGQSNMTGRRLPLGWTKKLRDSSLPCHQNTYSLLDAAALATTSPIDLSDASSAPDFTAVSFYKIFGFPDLGALIVRKDSGHILSWRKYFGGGTVNMITVLHEATVLRKDATLHDTLEDGTLPFHSIVALGCAMEAHKKLFVSMKTISDHTSYLASRLYNGMVNLRHQSGAPVCAIYNETAPRCVFGNPKLQGGTIAFNVLRADGSCVGYTDVENRANEQNIYLRSGGLCNPGGIATYLDIQPWQFKRAWSGGHRCGDGGIDLLNGKPTGVVRASLGAMSTTADVDALLDFLASEFVEKLPVIILPESLPEPVHEPVHEPAYELVRESAHDENEKTEIRIKSYTPLKSSVLESEPRRMVSSPELRKRLSNLSVKDYGQLGSVAITKLLASSSPIIHNHPAKKPWGTTPETDRVRKVQVIVRDDEVIGLDEGMRPKKRRSFMKYFHHRPKEYVV